MKKYFLLIILYLGICPIIHKGKLSVLHIQHAHASSSFSDEDDDDGDVGDDDNDGEDDWNYQVVSDDDFDDFIAYVENQGDFVGDPTPYASYSYTDANGNIQTGEITPVYYPTTNASGVTTWNVATYFSPDNDSNPLFPLGTETLIVTTATNPDPNVNYIQNAILLASLTPTNAGDPLINDPIQSGGGGNTFIENPTEVDWADDPDNVVLTDPDPVTYAEYQQTTPWPTIPNIIPFEQFVPFRFKSNGQEENCLVLSKEQLAKIGYSISGYLPSTQTFQTYSTSGVNLSRTKQAITYLISALSNKIPVIAGVDAFPGSPNIDGITDHFITIDGMGTDSNGNYFHFVDNSTTNPGTGDFYGNKLYYNATTGIITGACNTGYTSQGAGGHNYIVTQIRKSIKN